MEKINDITCFFFGFDDESKHRVIAATSTAIKRGKEIHEVWIEIGKLLELNGITNVAWNVQAGVSFYNINCKN